MKDTTETGKRPENKVTSRKTTCPEIKSFLSRFERILKGFPTGGKWSSADKGPSVSKYTLSPRRQNEYAASCERRVRQHEQPIIHVGLVICPFFPNGVMERIPWDAHPGRHTTDARHKRHISIDRSPKDGALGLRMMAPMADMATFQSSRNFRFPGAAGQDCGWKESGQNRPGNTQKAVPGKLAEMFGEEGGGIRGRSGVSPG